MHWKIELFFYGLLLIAAILALQLRNLLAAVALTTVFSFLCALLFVLMGAVDVAFTEAVIGAGIVGLFFLAALRRTTRRSQD